MRIIKRKAIVPTKRAIITKSLASLIPTESTLAEIDPSRLVLLTIAPVKWGKTSFVMSNKHCLLLGFEEGHKFRRGKKMRIVAWDKKSREAEFNAFKDDEGVTNCTAMQALKALQDDKTDNIRTVAVDTFDMAGKMCADHFCEEAGVDHISEMGEYGKGYDVGQNTPMRRFILGILKTGRGLVLITHTKIENYKFRSGEQSKKETTLGKGLRALAESQADVIMHGEFGKLRPGNKKRDRIFVCEGDEETMAGNRSDASLPGRYIVSKTDAWKQFCSFFTDANAAEKAEKFEKSIRQGGGGGPTIVKK